VPAAQQVGQLALHDGPVGAVVSPPGRITLPGSGRLQPGLVRVDGDGPPGRAAGAGCLQRADLAGAAEAGHPATMAGWDDRHHEPGRAGDRARIKVNPEAVLGEVASGAVAAATLVIAVTPRPSSSASSAAAIAASPVLAAPASAAVMTSLSGSMATWPL
jgi:hypothetical protein